MSVTGTDAYACLDPASLPPLVARAVAAARAHGFPYSCRPEHGRLLQALAGGARTVIGETGTGYGVGLAWLASGAGADVRLVSAERDPERARVAAEVFAGDPRVTVLTRDWTRIDEDGPYDLLVLDGGGQGKTAHAPAADVSRLLAPGGTVVLDDFTPSAGWPPLHEGKVDTARLYWLEHRALDMTEIRLADDLAALVGSRCRMRGTETEWRGLEHGDVVRGVVTHVAAFGVFVELPGGLQGFAAVPELHWQHFDAVQEVVRVGQEVTAEVLAFDVEREQVRLSLKALEPDPWLAFARESLGRTLRGRVTKVAPIGVFVQVAEGVEGLVPRELLGRPCAVGDELSVDVTGINLRRRRIALAVG
ncbi:S1 RNA-binding domain-containing protein [Streptomyces griseosporeus]|uniref:S1 RNA-binding domain-containing protein n=1 Tax=Streptomyces griseosporeus TaxID=1910 RepID=UPI0037034C18